MYLNEKLHAYVLKFSKHQLYFLKLQCTHTLVNALVSLYDREHNTRMICSLLNDGRTSFLGLQEQSQVLHEPVSHLHTPVRPCLSDPKPLACTVAIQNITDIWHI